MPAEPEVTFTKAELAVIAVKAKSDRQRIDNMLPAARLALDEHGPDVGLFVLARAFTGQPGWTRDELALVLAAALERVIIWQTVAGVDDEAPAEEPCPHVLAAIHEADDHAAKKLPDWLLWKHAAGWLRKRFEVTDHADVATVWRMCTVEYERAGGREPGDRSVRCHLRAGHAGDHIEADTEVSWPADRAVTHG